MRILQYLGGVSSWGDVNPKTMRDKGLGGRETALIQLAEHWAEGGHEVINFVPVSSPYKEKAYYVDHKQLGGYVNNFDADVLVSWEESRVFQESEFLNSIKLKVIEMQVAHLRITEEAAGNTDIFAVLSKWAGDFLLSQSSYINPDKLEVLPNGVDLRRYPAWSVKYPPLGQDPKLFPWRFYYSSSPDRGLQHLLNLWPRIRDRFPNAELKIAYGIEHWADQTRWTHNKQAEAALDIIEGLNQDGVNYLGKIGQDELAQVQVESHALLYPCDTMQPTETGCITIIEAGAAGTPAITTDCDCLGSEFAQYAAISRLPFDPDGYVDTISKVISSHKTYTDLQRRGNDLARSRSWLTIADRWLDLFEERIYAPVN